MSLTCFGSDSHSIIGRVQPTDRSSLLGTQRIRLGSALVLLGGICAGAGALAPTGSAHTDVLNVVAGENFWGSLASQLGGKLVQVTSIVTDPNADPHEYESNSSDARAFAAARFVVLNGAGYDDWANRLLSAQSEPGRRVLTVSTLLHKKAGDNPHFWYDPNYVVRVINRITSDYESLEPRSASYFAGRHKAVESALAPYRSRLAYITKHFSGTPVAATESIFQYLAQYLHLDLVTPVAFMQAVSEGIDPPASSVATFDQQITGRRFHVLVYNRQTVSPLTTGIRNQALAKHIPAVAVSETIQPPTASFQKWMDGELDALTKALQQTRGSG